MPGTVYLVGAGPGDPGLLTCRAMELLRSLPVVAYDELVHWPILNLARPDAEMIPVGRRSHHPRPEFDRIHPAVLDRAATGQDVMRLKCGDPFVFGRGGEEAEALAERGIPFEVVPGISSGVAAPAYAGIPLTHRFLSSSALFTVGTEVNGSAGHEKEGTIVLFMALKNLSSNLAQLQEQGHQPATPAALIHRGTTSRQEVLVGTLETLPGIVATKSFEGPCLVVVGDVVRMRERIAWFDRRPLFGRTLVVARARASESKLVVLLRQRGAEVLEAPLVALLRGGCPPPAIPADTVLLLRSSAVIPVILRALADAGQDIHALSYMAIGTETAEMLSELGLRAMHVAPGLCESALGETPLQGRHVVVPCAVASRPRLLDDLARLGARAMPWEAYEVRRTFPRFHPRHVDLFVFPASTAVEYLVGGDHPLCRMRGPAVVMGPRTAQAAREAGFGPIATAVRDTLEDLVACVEAALAEKEEAYVRRE